MDRGRPGAGGAAPGPEAVRGAVFTQLAFMDKATRGHHCRGGKIIPFSLHNVDEVLGDLGLNIPARVRASHWLNPVDPTAYRDITPRLVRSLPTHVPTRRSAAHTNG